MNTLLIATVRTNDELRPLVEEIRMTVASDLKLVISSSRESVAINVNRGLNSAEGDFILKVDDDITGFQRGWDLKLIEPMQQDPMIGAVAARLLNKDGSVQLTCSGMLICIRHGLSPIVRSCRSAVLRFAMMEPVWTNGTSAAVMTMGISAIS